MYALGDGEEQALRWGGGGGECNETLEIMYETLDSVKGLHDECLLHRWMRPKP